MKKIIAIIAVFAISVLVSCDQIERKLAGVEIKFADKIKNSAELSFDAELKTEIDGEKSELAVKCYRKNLEYAYVFSDPDDASKVYRRLYADNALYEVLTVTKNLILTEAQGGVYYVDDNVSVQDENNFLYQIEQNIMLASYSSLALIATKEDWNGTTVYRYDLNNIDGNDYKLWYDDENLVKIAADISIKAEDGTTSTDKYEAEFSNYKFAEIDRSQFIRPNETAGYVESPRSFESWMTIFDKFGKMSAGWTK